VISFKGEIEHKGYNYFVKVPLKISQHFDQKGNIPVRGNVNTHYFKGYLSPRKPNSHVLYLHADIRKRANLNIGDCIVASIEFDPESRDIEIPEDVEWILKEDGRNWNKFMNLTAPRRNEILRYILEAKRPETRLRRIEYFIKRLSERIS
jgi:hypothetical protein